jgi:Ca2+-binding EF-hand superfamily protein
VLNFTEFIDLMVNDKSEIEEDLELIEAFHAFDRDETGIVCFFLQFVSYDLKRSCTFLKFFFVKS